MMQTGFAMLCAGSVRQKNVKNIMLKNILDACLGAIGFYSIGYGLAFGGDTTDVTFVGNTAFGLRGVDTSGYAFFFFQFAFAASAATIVAGTVAERCKMSAYICYSFFLTSFVYPVIVHSIWSINGFLSAFNTDPFRGIGVIDFAGSGVVRTRRRRRRDILRRAVHSLNLHLTRSPIDIDRCTSLAALHLWWLPLFWVRERGAFMMKMGILWRHLFRGRPIQSHCRFLERFSSGSDGMSSVSTCDMMPANLMYNSHQFVSIS